MWGALPEVYWASNRRPATRFASNSFVTGHWGGRPQGDLTGDLATPGALDQFLADFGEHPPRYVIDTAEETVARQLRRPEIRALLGDLPSGEPHKIDRPSGPPSSWPELRASARRAA